LGFVFDHEAASKHEAWFETETGRITFTLQQEMILRLLRPRRMERILDVGCGSGRLLEYFYKQGLDTTGLEPSRDMRERARVRLGLQVPLYQGVAEDLPFEDNEFDIVTLVNCLEFIDEPEKALAEAVRVAGNRVFIGVLNKWSLTALGRRTMGLFRDSVYNRSRFYSVLELARLAKNATGPTRIRWASVGQLPPVCARCVQGFEAGPLVQNSPFGSFLGVVADVIYTMRTDNLVVDMGYKIKSRAAPSPTGCGARHGSSDPFKRPETYS
jgi:ubiquinone/menaquinone biosynthesis C-methylase UbiE